MKLSMTANKYKKEGYNVIDYFKHLPIDIKPSKLNAPWCRSIYDPIVH
jgi:hypothetical protein